CREKERKTSCCYQQRQHDEPDRLIAQERTIRFRAVGEIRARQTVTDPKQSGQTEIKQIEWARLGIGIAMDEQQHDRREPQRAEHPEPVPERSTHPSRRRLSHPWCCRSDLKDGCRRGKLGHSRTAKRAVGALKSNY